MIIIDKLCYRSKLRYVSAAEKLSLIHISEPTRH